MEIIFDKKTILTKGKFYIEKFKNEIFLIKYGGSNLDDQNISHSILEDIVYLHRQGINIAVVHGGGCAITRLMQQKDKQVKFVDGNRVTDEETAAIVDEALINVNADIVNEIKKIGARAKPIISREHGVIKARRRDGSLHDDFTGDVDSINTEKIKAVFDLKAIPVISPVGIGQDNMLYNINADFAATEIAIALHAKKLIFLTNVRGIMKNHIDESTLLPTIKEKQIEKMIKDRVVSSGMIPKARASVKAIFGSVEKVHIISGRIKHSLLIEVLTDEGVGTEIIK